MKRRHFLLTSLLAAMSCQFRGCLPTHKRKVICHGDSVTDGYRVYPHRNPAGSYPAGIQMVYGKWRIRSTGKAGNNMSDGLSRFHVDVLLDRPSHVTIMFGLNDLGTNEHRFRGALTSMILQARAWGIKPIVCTTTPHMDFQGRMQEINNSIRDVVSVMRVPLADVAAAFPYDWKYMATSNHPNDAGHKIITNVITGVLR